MSDRDPGQAPPAGAEGGQAATGPGAEGGQAATGLGAEGGQRATGPGAEGPTSAAPAGAETRLDALQRLWTPWRMAYVSNPDKRSSGCPFCRLPAGDPAADAESHILHRGERCFVILNAYPYNPGHLMVVPYRHTPGLDDLDDDEAAELTRLTQRSLRVLRETSGPHGFNVGVNMGGIAGAGIAEHVHQHVVPRWGGDTNFMPVIGQTKILPQLLDETYERLKAHFV